LLLVVSLDISRSSRGYLDSIRGTGVVEDRGVGRIVSKGIEFDTLGRKADGGRAFAGSGGGGRKAWRDVVEAEEEVGVSVSADG
jgi:hypothetical protein